MEGYLGEGGIEPRRDACSFYVAGVPPVLFSKDPEASVRVSYTNMKTFGACEMLTMYILYP